MTRSCPPLDGRAPVDHRNLTECERRALPAAVRYARRHDLATPADEAYRRELRSARWGILARLLGGLARDRPAGLPDPVFVDATAPTVPDGPGDPLGSLDGDALTARVPDAEGADRVLVLPFPASETVVSVHVRSRRAFDRFTFAPPAVTCSLDATEPVGSPESLVPLVDCERVVETVEARDRFRSELGESVANLALARLARRVRWSGLSATPTPTTTRPSEPTSHRRTSRTSDAQPVDARGTGSQERPESASFDQLVTGGHPFHPGAKIRRGMAPTEVLSLDPTVADSVPVRFAAVHRDCALESSTNGESLTDRLYETFPGLRMAVGTALPSGRPVSEYAVLPMHPWQFRHVLPDRYADAQRAASVVPVPSYTVEAAPLLSLRTVVPRPGAMAGEHPPHLKLALGVQTTNAVRTLSPNAVVNGPQLTDALTAACEAAPLDSFGVLPEPAATCYHPTDDPVPDGPAYDDARHLSALARQHPATHPIVGPDECAVTGAGLLACPPPDRQSVLDATLDAFGDGLPDGDRASVVESFLSAYLDAVIPGALELLVTRGIALEAHLQNTYVVFDDARPTGALVGDFGGVRVFEDRFGEADLTPYPDSDVFTDEVTAAREKLWYSLFQNHVGELLGRLCATEPVTATECWRLVRACCERTFDDLAARDDVSGERVAADRASLFDDRVVHKALTAMRLRDATHDYSKTSVANPLAAHEPARIGGR